MSRLDYRRKKEREKEREARGESAFIEFVKTHIGLIVLGIIVLSVIAAAVFVSTNPDYRDRITGKDKSEMYLDTNAVFEMSYVSKENTTIKIMGSSAVICNKEQIMLLSDTGEIKWDIKVSLNSPILSVSGEYILAADRGGKNIYLINNGKVILNQTSQYNIINADVCANGNFVIISEEPYYKGVVSVKNAKGEDIFVWHSGSSYIIDAAVGADTNKIAVATLNTKITEEVLDSISSSVLMFDLYSDTPYATQEFGGCVIAKVFASSKGFEAVMDKKSVYINDKGEIDTQIGYENKNLTRFCRSDNVSVIAMEEGSKKSLLVLDSHGEKKCEIALKYTPSFISAAGDRILYGGGNEMIVCDKSGKELYVMQSAKQFSTVSLFENASRVIGQTSASIDILEVK